MISKQDDDYLISIYLNAYYCSHRNLILDGVMINYLF